MQQIILDVGNKFDGFEYSVLNFQWVCINGLIKMSLRSIVKVIGGVKRRQQI
jgi:hypothetical protein